MHGQRLKKLRVDARMTQKKLADRLGISPSTVGMYEQNRRSPDNRTILKLCELFSTTADHLLGNDTGSGSPLPKSTETELSVLIADIKRELYENKHLTFNGVPLTKRDITKIMDAMRTGAEIVLKKNRKKYTAKREARAGIQGNMEE